MFNKEKGKELSLTGGFSLTPRTLDEAMSLAKIMADSDLVPKDYKSKPGNVLIAVQMGAEVGLPPMQAMQSIAVINGKPSIYGDVGKALLRSRGCDIIESSDEENKKTGMARCRIVRKGQQDVEKTFSIEDAKTAHLWGKQGPWTEYPYNQLGWRAFWFAARRAAPDILKGLSGREEVLDYSDAVDIEVVPQPQRASATTTTTPEAPNTQTQTQATATPLVEPKEDTMPQAVVLNQGESEIVVKLERVEYKQIAPGEYEYTIHDIEGITYFTTDKPLAKLAKTLVESHALVRVIWKMSQKDLTLPAVRTLVRLI